MLADDFDVCKRLIVIPSKTNLGVGGLLYQNEKEVIGPIIGSCSYSVNATNLGLLRISIRFLFSGWNFFFGVSTGNTPPKETKKKRHNSALEKDI